MNEHHSIIIIGAGLSGLFLAYKLHQTNRDVIILEARNRIGGRILSSGYGQTICTSDSRVDLGPSWIWPELQPRLKKLLDELGLEVFKQYTDGDILYEFSKNKIERFSGQSSHNLSYRLIGGMQTLVEALQAQLPESLVQLKTKVTVINRQPLRVECIRNGEVIQYSADKVVLALPPRITHHGMQFNPQLPNNITVLWQNTPTWMASHCKIIFIYDNPFWRKQHFSGEVFSHSGPLSEIYDGSPENEHFYALTSFVRLNAQQRSLIPVAQLKTMCLEQLNRLFGADSQKIKEIYYKDWSLDNCTTTKTDLSSIARHPDYPDELPRHLWNKQLFLAGTEVARNFGGYLEGALESAEETLLDLKTNDINPTN